MCVIKIYDAWDHFLTFTCNKKTHCGTAPRKNWVDNEYWKKCYPNYSDLETDKVEEISEAVTLTAENLLVCIWAEVTALFMDYLKKSKSIPFKKLNAIFLRKEYQKLCCNLSHTHSLLQPNWDEMTKEEKVFVDSEVPELIKHGIIETEEDVDIVFEFATKFLPHIFNDTCLVRIADGSFCCCKIDYLKASTDNTSIFFIHYPTITQLIV